MSADTGTHDGYILFLNSQGLNFREVSFIIWSLATLNQVRDKSDYAFIEAS